MSARRSSGGQVQPVVWQREVGRGQGGHERRQRGAEGRGRLARELAGQVADGEHDGSPALHAVGDAAGVWVVDVDGLVDVGLLDGELDGALDVAAHVADHAEARRGGGGEEPADRRPRHQARIRRVPEHAVEEHGELRQPALKGALVQRRLPEVLVQRERRRGSRRATMSCSANTTLCTARREASSPARAVTAGPANRSSRPAGATGTAPSASVTSCAPCEALP